MRKFIQFFALLLVTTYAFSQGIMLAPQNHLAGDPVTHEVVTSSIFTEPSGLRKRGLDVAIQQSADKPATASQVVYSDYQASLANGAEIDSGWLDCGKADKVQFSGYASASGMTMTLESRADESQAALSTSVTYTDGAFYMFNVLCRQRYMRFKWTNNTGSGVTNASAEVKFSYGSSDKLSVFPVGVQPSDFSQAALVQSISRGQAPDGVYTSVPTSGVAIETTDALTAGSTYTSSWIDVSGYDSAIVAAKTDQDGEIVLEYSPDMTNVDSTLTRYYRTSQIEPPHRFTNTRKYLRVKFNNTSSSDQTYLRFQVTLKVVSIPLNIPTDSTVAQDFDAISTRPTDYTTEVALGRRQGATTWNKFGYNDDVDTADNDAILSEFGPTTSGAFTFSTAGETLSVVSSSTNDIDTTGTGVRKAVIYGVDSNWDSVVEVLPLNGTSAVTTTNSYIGINRLTIFQSGSANSNVGKITATGSSTGNYYATMPAGQGTSQQLIFYVPRNHQFLATWLLLGASKTSGGGSPNVLFKGFVYSEVVQSQFEVFRKLMETQDSQTFQISPSEPFVIGEKSILWFTANTSANDTEVTGRFSGKLIGDVDR